MPGNFNNRNDNKIIICVYFSFSSVYPLQLQTKRLIICGFVFMFINDRIHLLLMRIFIDFFAIGVGIYNGMDITAKRNTV